MFGTIVNTIAVIVGSLLGLLFRGRFSESMRRIAFQGLGLVTLLLGVSMGLRTGQPLVLVLSILFGGICGQWLGIADWIERLVDRFKRKIKNEDSRFTSGLITAFLLFCMGSLTVIGAMEEGMGKGADLLLVKSVMDAFASMALAAGMGIGVLFSAPLLLVYQGLWTAIGWGLQSVMPEFILNEISAVGGVLLLGLGIDLLEIKTIKVANFLPALLFAILFAWLFLYFKLV